MNGVFKVQCMYDKTGARTDNGEIQVVYGVTKNSDGDPEFLFFDEINNKFFWQNSFGYYLIQ